MEEEKLERSIRKSEIPGLTREEEEAQLEKVIGIAERNLEQAKADIRPGPLEFMKGSVDSPYGVISAGWERKGDKIEYQVTIPVNTTATLFKNTEDPADTVELGSGTYTFML